MGSLLCNMGFLQTLNLPEGAPMPSPVRDRMISGALDLLARRGLQATSFAEVTQATQTPRGSIYHHFPGGKQELVLAAIDLNAQQWLDVVASVERRSPERVVSELLGRLRTYLDETKFEAGSAVGAVTVAAALVAPLTPAAHAQERNMVIFGDSVISDPNMGQWAAGKLGLDPRGRSDNGTWCPTSPTNWGKRSAGMLGLTPRDYSCTGVVTISKGPGLFQQVDRAIADRGLSPATARVIISAGFNDTYNNNSRPDGDIRRDFTRYMVPQINRIRAAAQAVPDFMRAAGCVINDYADRWLDGQVERTRGRPLVTGEVSGREALVLFLVLMLLAFALVLTLNRLAIWMSVAPGRTI